MEYGKNLVNKPSDLSEGQRVPLNLAPAGLSPNTWPSLEDIISVSHRQECERRVHFTIPNTTSLPLSVIAFVESCNVEERRFLETSLAAYRSSRSSLVMPPPQTLGGFISANGMPGVSPTLGLALRTLQSYNREKKDGRKQHGTRCSLSFRDPLAEPSISTAVEVLRCAEVVRNPLLLLPFARLLKDVFPTSSFVALCMEGVRRLMCSPGHSGTSHRHVLHQRGKRGRGTTTVEDAQWNDKELWKISAGWSQVLTAIGISTPPIPVTTPSVQLDALFSTLLTLLSGFRLDLLTGPPVGDASTLQDPARQYRTQQVYSLLLIDFLAAVTGKISELQLNDVRDLPSTTGTTAFSGDTCWLPSSLKQELITWVHLPDLASYFVHPSLFILVTDALEDFMEYSC